MKKIRLLLLLLLSFAFILILTGCRCEPSKHQWYIKRFQINTVYANGVEQVETYDGIPDIDDPFGGMENGIVDIQFSEDGKVTFKPGTGEVLTGTYTLKHNGFKNTNFTVTLDNGEKFSGTVDAYYYATDLTFVFRDMQYCFEKAYRDAEEIYQEDMSYMPDHILRHVDSGYVKRSTVLFIDGEYSLTVENGDTVILDDNTTVKCVRLDEDTMTVLNSIKEGKCFSRIESRESGKNNVLIYYIEPYPGEPLEPTVPEPDPLMLSELEPWISDLSSAEITEIKFVKDYVNIPAGNKKHIQHITDKEKIENIIAVLKSIELTEMSGANLPITPETKYDLKIYTESGEYCLWAIGSYWTNNDSYWYSLSTFPVFEYEGAVKSFVECNTVAHIYYGETDFGEVGNPIITEIEFVEDTEDYDYTPNSYWTYEFDWGVLEVYDERHFRYKGQNYVVVGELVIPLVHSYD